MKKLLIILSFIFILTGCNRSVVDLSYHYNYAKIVSGDTIIKEGKVKNWSDYETSDSVSIAYDDGTKIYTQISNVILCQE